MTQAQTARFEFDLPDEAATILLAHRIAGFVGAGDLVTLSGDLGAGKTTLARALIRELVGESELEVPSPTFTLMQVYDGQRFTIVHADLYRIKSPDELIELGWDEAAEGALLLVEWAERAGNQLPEDRLDVALHLNPSKGDSFRKVVFTGTGAFAARLSRAMSVDALLARSGWADAKRQFMMGDASTRAYERLEKADGTKGILMISPKRPDGPPVRYGKPYSQIAHLAEDVIPFFAIQRGLLLCDGRFINPEDMSLDATNDARQNIWPVSSRFAQVTNQVDHNDLELKHESDSARRGRLLSEDKSHSGNTNSLPSDVKDLEREHILKILNSVNGHRKRAVNILGISERTLRYKLKQWREAGYQIP